jgi:hypothetical protein
MLSEIGESFVWLASSYIYAPYPKYLRSIPIDPGRAVRMLVKYEGIDEETNCENNSVRV